MTEEITKLTKQRGRQNNQEQNWETKWGNQEKKKWNCKDTRYP